MNSTATAWTGLLPTDDTALAVTDTGGPGRPVVYLNGGYASQRHWRRVLDDLGSGYRHITYDMRARGRSKRSVDNSFEACLRDLGVVLAARGVHRPLLVGWSYGALLAVHWAYQNPERTSGVVAVDGAYPYDWIDDAARERIRKMFNRTGWLLPVLRPLGLAAAMSAQEHAEDNIDLNERLGALGPTLDEVAVPVRYVVASGDSVGSSDGEQDRMRASLQQHLIRNPNLQVGATVRSNHGSILRKDHRAIAETVRELAAYVDGQTR